MDNLEKIEKWIDDRLLFAGLAVDNTKEVVDAYKLALTKTLAFVQSLKAEKPHGSECSCENCIGIPAQPDKGEMAWQVLEKIAEGVLPWCDTVHHAMCEVEAKHKETHERD